MAAGAGRSRLPVYALLSESGDDHAKTFRVSCTLAQPALVTEGEGSSRRAAEQPAAEAALQQLQADAETAAARECRRRRVQTPAACAQSDNPRMNTTAHRAGHVAVIGRPNVGKSTLVNALVGAKVSIVSPRPQTTRHRLLGIATFPRRPAAAGRHPRHPSRAGSAPAMNRWMNRAARGALEGVDAALLVVEAGRWDDDDTLAYEALQRRRACRWCWWSTRSTGSRTRPRCCRSWPRSAKAASSPACTRSRRSSARAWKRWSKTVLALLPEQPALYGEDEITDKSQRFLAGELVREQLMRQLGEELPYATTVEIETLRRSTARCCASAR